MLKKKALGVLSKFCCLMQINDFLKEQVNVEKKYLKIKGIPSVLWGRTTGKLFIAVHGNMSDKEDVPIYIFAKEAVKAGYQVLSFDLPEHGSRKSESVPCKVQNCIHELEDILEYGKSISNNISLFACSVGAYFSLVAYNHKNLSKCLFLSPVVDMEQIICTMLKQAGITKEKLKAEKKISTHFGQTFYWDYYCYVKEHPIENWEVLTSILYGSNDDLCKFEKISSFSKRFNCDLKVMENGEHFFHTDEQLCFFNQWLKDIFE